MRTFRIAFAVLILHYHLLATEQVPSLNHEVCIPFSIDRHAFLGIADPDYEIKAPVSLYVDVFNDTNDSIFFPVSTFSASHMTLITETDQSGDHFLSRSGGGKRHKANVQPLFALIEPGKTHRVIIYENRDIWTQQAMRIEVTLGGAYYHLEGSKSVDLG